MLLSIVVPLLNEDEALLAFHSRLCSAVHNLETDVEIVYVNDGSTDGTLHVLDCLTASDDRISIIDLSRNFGKEIAMTAGLEHARGDAVVVIDADLQDPPEMIAEMVRGFNEGYDVVYAKRIARDGESVMRKVTAKFFYRGIRHLSKVEIPEDTGDFRLLSRRAVNSLLMLREHHRYMKGLFAWIGYRQKAVPYRRDPRCAGSTKWNYWKLWNFALEGITSFTIAPLKMASYVGLLVAVGSFLYAGYIIYDKLVFGNAVAGYPSLVVMILFIGGVELICLGIIGEYLGRIFNETKNRPLYLVKAHRPSKWDTGKQEKPLDVYSVRAS